MYARLHLWKSCGKFGKSALPSRDSCIELRLAQGLTAD